MKDTKVKKWVSMYVRMIPEMHEEIRTHAFERRISLNSLFVLALADYLRKQKEYDNQ